jgi:hypothetical protein
VWPARYLCTGCLSLQWILETKARIDRAEGKSARMDRGDSDRPSQPAALQSTTCKAAETCWYGFNPLVQNCLVRDIRISMEQALLGADLTNCHPATPVKWWEILRGVTCWLLWKSRCECYFQGNNVVFVELCSRIWHRLKQYIRISWDANHVLVKRNVLSQAEASKQFNSEFGSDFRIFYISGGQLYLSGSETTMEPEYNTEEV